MRPLSLASTLVWLLAGNEAARSRREYIDVDHLYLSLCKCSGFRKEETARIVLMLRAPSEQLSETHDQFELLRDVFRKISVDPHDNRHKLRARQGMGTAATPSPELHRTDTCRNIFRLADTLSRDSNDGNISPLHLMWAIFSADDSVPVSFLAEQGVDREMVVTQCRSALRKIDKRTEHISADPVVSEFLEKLGRNLSGEARHGRLNPVIGMKNELFQLMQALLRQDKNGILLLGEPGVGKTCLVEGLAQLLISSRIPEKVRHLQHMSIIELTPSSLTAGMKHMGDFERQMTDILAEAETKKDSLIIFIDEFHMIMGAGKTGQAMDAANILKPALSRGRINLIGATTIQEYVQFIEPDQAFDRRFVKIFVNEPSVDECIRIIEGLRNSVEHKYSISIPAAIVPVLVDLTNRYLPSRRQPDKSIDILHQAATRKLLGSSASSFWRGVDSSRQPESGESPELSGREIAAVLADVTKIPANRIMQKADDRVLMICDELREKIIGQDEAVKTVCSCLKRAGLGLTETNRPDGVFLFLGPTGVGKTALAKALAASLFGQAEGHLLHLDMSEYHDRHQISRLIGAPPGYIGYDKEGELTGFIRKNPYAVVLFDEVEKAHPDIFDLFLQLFDEGRLTDSHGRRADFSHTFIILTANPGPHGIGERIKLGIQLDDVMTGIDHVRADTREARRHLEAGLGSHFRPEILNRIDAIIPFYPLGPEALIAIAHQMIADFLNRLRTEQNIELTVDDDVYQIIARKGYNKERGARELKRVIDAMLIGPVADYILHHRLPENGVSPLAQEKTCVSPSGHGELSGKFRLSVDERGAIDIRRESGDQE